MPGPSGPSPTRPPNPPTPPPPRPNAIRTLPGGITRADWIAPADLCPRTVVV